MPAVNASGWPYPLPTEPVRDGAAAIKALADALPVRGYMAVTGSATVNCGTGLFTNVPTPTAEAGGYGAANAGLSNDAISIIVGQAGVYLITLTAVWSANATGRRMLGFSGTSGDGTADAPGPNALVSMAAHAGNTISQKFAEQVYLAAGTRIMMRAFQDSGATLSIGHRRASCRRVF